MTNKARRCPVSYSDVVTQTELNASPVAVNPSIPQLLSVRDVCAIFGRDARTIRRWTKNEHLHAIRVGGAVFFDAEDVAAVARGRI